MDWKGTIQPSTVVATPSLQQPSGWKYFLAHLPLGDLSLPLQPQSKTSFPPLILPGPVAAPLLELSSSHLLKALGPWAGIQNIPSNWGSLQSEISSRGESKVCCLPNGSELLTLHSELLHVHTCPLYGGLPQVGDMGHRQGQLRGRIHQGFSLHLRVPPPHD